MKTKCLIENAEQRLREHLKSKRNDDDEAALLAITPGLIRDFGPNIASFVLADDSWSERIQRIRCSLNPVLVPEIN